ncbi:MAG: class aminotransferase [Frankiales bacterium]|nr:class aminotransferase [Frankiales bacterium]
MTLWNGVPATPEQLEHLASSSYGCYTFFQVRERQVRGLQLHLERLTGNARELFGEAPTREQLTTQVAQAVASDDPCSVRITLIGADHQPVLSGDVVTPDVVVTIAPPRDEHAPAISVRTTTYQRETPHVKHLGTHGLIRETRTARQAGYDDALLVDADGQISEGTTWNLLVHDGDSWLWPDAPMLAGITATLLRQAMDDQGVPHRTSLLRGSDLDERTAGFALNSSARRRISAVDGRALEDGAAVGRQLDDLWRTTPGEPLD